MQAKNPLPSRLLVRHLTHNKFLSPAGRWVKRAEAALNFPNSLNAINTCLGRGLKDVELILHFEGNQQACHVPPHAIQLPPLYSGQPFSEAPSGAVPYLLNVPACD